MPVARCTPPPRAALVALLIASLSPGGAATSEARQAALGPPDLVPTFSDVTAAYGIDFRHHHGGTGDKQLPETMGSGVAWLDFDGDGL